ncbi:NtaA/DmoA family FMN-dependent monooxygenase [Corynebacterium sp. 21KM1197]|uniref:NtaA/DmoA family FMN-dependent monooxygenase n=1 Tax=Corynebacterium sp. 21KM1197 TaxID=2989734 RepID=UPI0029CA8054|nr:NtaA/DmoA family FMN-dependent monooxygenase [Corynebacterium sp. 21KM1197]WPF68174.1 NtaA/DmoA family FMN-dependent monooxygenase [Corynebacterium sp. 21KM1197]
MTKNMIIGIGAFAAAGAQARAWQLPEVSSKTYPDFEGQNRVAQIAEKGKFHFLFYGDFPGSVPTSNEDAPQMTVDPLISIASAAAHTSHVGFAATMATEWHTPFTIARQFKALDALTGGRTAWNAVTGSSPQAASLYGKTIPSSPERYGRAQEFVQIVQSFWGSWGKDAFDAADGKRIFADYSKVERLSLHGQYLSAQGSLPIPPTPQGQPVMFHSGGSPNSIAFAGRYADVYITEVWDPAQAAEQRRQLREAAVAAGREADDVKFIVGLMPTIADSKREALDQHAYFMEPKYRQQVRYLSMFFNTPLTEADLDKPLSAEALEQAKHAQVGDPRQGIALKVAQEGWSIRDIINHSVIDYHPGVQGTAQDVVDHMVQWYEAEAADGFWLLPDTHDVALTRFVDEVVPLLQKKGLFHQDYEGTTLRENLGLREQYGVDPRILQEGK